MSKGLAFFLGIITGVLLVLLCVLVRWTSAENSNSDDPGISMFDSPGEKMELKSFRVFQVLSDGSALAESSKKIKVDYRSDYSNPIVYFLPEEGVAYYDDQEIRIPTNKVARQIGIYKYTTKGNTLKTVPIVSFLDK